MVVVVVVVVVKVTLVIWRSGLIVSKGWLQRRISGCRLLSHDVERDVDDDVVRCRQLKC